MGTRAREYLGRHSTSTASAPPPTSSLGDIELPSIATMMRSKPGKHRGGRIRLSLDGC